MGKQKELTFEEEIDINIYKLHEELRDQPKLYSKYAKPYAISIGNAKRKEEQVKLIKIENKAELDAAKASMDMEIRNNPEKFGKTEKSGAKKHTETAISSIIASSKDFQDLNKKLNDKLKKGVQEHIDSIEEMEVLFAGVNACNHRKSSLENEVKLFIGGFYSEPKIERENKEQIKEKSDKKRKSIVSGLKKVKRKE